MTQAQYQDSVFINCPFDCEYDGVFKAVVFAVKACGFIPRCAMEVDDASQVRIEKIVSIIKDSKFGIHDLSRTQLDKKTGLPRFNMPLELGLFLGAKKFASGRQKEKVCLILDSEKFRYQCFISDIAGQDIRAHEENPDRAIKHVRNWLSTASRRKTIPGGTEICWRYFLFSTDLPGMCDEIQLDAHDLTFADFSDLVSRWLRHNYKSDISDKTD